MSDEGASASIINSGKGKMTIWAYAISSTGKGQNTIENTGEGTLTVGAFSNIDNLVYRGSDTGTQALDGNQSVSAGGSLEITGGTWSVRPSLNAESPLPKNVAQHQPELASFASGSNG